MSRALGDERERLRAKFDQIGEPGPVPGLSVPEFIR